MGKAQQKSDKSNKEVEDRIWQLAQDIDICMFMTWDGKQQHARPLSARVKRDEHAIYFLVDEEGDKNAEIKQFPAVTLTFTDSAGHKYVAIAGKASVTNNRKKIQELWTDFDKAWWNDATDPRIRLVTVVPKSGELWDSPNRVVATVKMLVAAVTGAKPEFGDNATVKL